MKNYRDKKETAPLMLNFEFVLQKSGIGDLIPGTVIDDVLFEPCGYSMNGLLPNVRAHFLQLVNFTS